MLKRLVAMLLCLSIFMTLIPATVLADTDTSAVQNPEETVSQALTPEESAFQEDTPEETVSQAVTPEDTGETTVFVERLDEITDRQPDLPEETLPTSQPLKIPDTPSDNQSAVSDPAQSDLPTSGSLGALQWKLENRVLTISGSGRMPSAYTFESHWHNYSGLIDEVIIQEGVTSIGDYAFCACDFSKVSIPTTVTGIGTGAFQSCNNLTALVVPEGVKTIAMDAFLCKNLTSLFLPSTLTYIHLLGLQPSDPDITRYIYYPGTKNAWNHIRSNKGDNLYNETGFNDVKNAILRYDYGKFSMVGMMLHQSRMPNYFGFLGDPAIYNSHTAKTNYYHTLDDICYIERGYTADDFTWTSSNPAVMQIVPNGKTVPDFAFLKEGSVRITVTGPWGDSMYLDVNVDDVSGFALTCKYDTDYYYSDGAFYSAVTSLSDAVDVFLKMGNVYQNGYPCRYDDGFVQYLDGYEDVLLTAMISGDDLSFSEHTYQNVVTVPFDEILPGDNIGDLLMLYPRNPATYTTPAEGKSYTLNLRLACDSFLEPIEQTITFKVHDGDNVAIQTHVDFVTRNAAYEHAKANPYQYMEDLREDSEYVWSRISSLDFENYYEIMVADLLISVLEVEQQEAISLMPKVLKKYYGAYKVVTGSVKTIVQQKYTDIFDISETKISKILKSNRFLDENTKYVDHDLYQAVVATLGDENNAEAIRKTFQGMDTCKQVYQLVSTFVDPINELIAWTNTLGVMNAFCEADEELKEVFREIAVRVDSDDYQVKEAFMDYVEYDHDYADKIIEIYETVLDHGTQTALTTFKSFVGKKFWDWGALKLLQWAGTIKLKDGSTFASTSVYAKLSSKTAAAVSGAVLNGVSIGLTLSDLLCSSSEKSTQMGKLIAACSFSDYIIRELEHCELQLNAYQDVKSTTRFHYAFVIHTASQRQIMNQTVKVLEAKGESLIQRFWGNQEYKAMVEEVLANKLVMDNLVCCENLINDHPVEEIKVFAVRCPVEICLYNQSNRWVLDIDRDGTYQGGEGMAVYVRDEEKYIAVFSDQTYKIDITAYATGTMDYSVAEYDSGVSRLRTLEVNEIPLYRWRKFVGYVPRAQDQPFGEFMLTSGNETFVPQDPQVIAGRQNMHMLRMYDPNGFEHFYTGSTEEKDNLVQAGWNYEGVGFTFSLNAGEPVYRLYEPENGEHLFTMSETEKQAKEAAGWIYEGIAFNSATKYEVPQYRLRNPNAKRGGYHYTGSTEERDNLISLGWIDEGIGFYSCWG